MQVSIEQVNSLTRRMTVGIAKERIQKAVQTRLQSVARTAKVNGFRPGKVPMRLVEQKYGEQIYLEVLESLISDTLGEALKAQSLNPVARPDVELLNDISSVRSGEDFSYAATFEIYPELTEIKYQDGSVDRPVVEIGEADVDTVLEKLRVQAAKWQEAPRSPTKDDRVVISVLGTLNGEAFQNNTINEEEIGITQTESILTGLSDALLGFMPGETRTLTLPLSLNHPSPEFAGQMVEAQVTLHAVKEMLLPEINAEFANSLGVESGDMNELRTEVTRNMGRELKQALQKYLRSEVLAKLREQNPIDVPAVLVEQELNRMVNNFFDRVGMAEKTRDEQTVKNVKEVMAKNGGASENVHAGLLLSELIHANHIEFSAEQLRTHIEELSSTYEEPDSIIRYIYSNPEILKRIQSSVLEEQAIEWLLQRMQVTEQPMSFTKFMELVNSTQTRHE